MMEFIPSPATGVWHLGPIPLRAYAFCILVGIFAAIAIAERRHIAAGGRKGLISDVALWAVPFGIVGGRIYHVITDAQLYFGPGRNPVDALKIWEGGLGIWGAITAGALGVWIASRRHGVPFTELAHAIAPGLLVAQAIGRLGNYFNQELFGRPTTLPWGLEIDAMHRPVGFEQFATFHPTFLYELLWNLAAAGLLIWLDQRFRLSGDRLFALYAMLYTAGRFWIELLRIDTANHVGGMRLNNWTALVVFTAAMAYFFWSRRRTRDDREPDPRLDASAP
ncbi:MAG TPA: prolipoprotein diacylglyceryl transferase [Aeromicrobium sp.]|nr:prolipoprotein diacylglyceryl transferase [Aeromicrobium sp.]